MANPSTTYMNSAEHHFRGDAVPIPVVQPHDDNDSSLKNCKSVTVKGETFVSHEFTLFGKLPT